MGQTDDDEGDDDAAAAVNAALEFANQERLEGSLHSSPAPPQKTKPNSIRSLVSDSTSILREYLEDLCDPERSYFTSLPEWRTGFPQPLQSVITSVSKGSHPQPARGLRALEDYLYLLKELQEVIGKIRAELLKRHKKSTLAVFRRRVGIVDELIAEIELVFRRKEYVDSDGKKWEDVAQKRLKWLLEQRKITKKIEQAQRKRAAEKVKDRMMALCNVINDLKSPAAYPVNDLENPAADPVNGLDNLVGDAVDNLDNLAGHDDNGEDYGYDDDQDDEEEMYTSDYTSEHDPIIIGGDAPVHRVRVDAFGNHERRQRPNTASPYQRRRQGSIVEDDIPWTKEEQIALWKAMATVVRENNGDLLWTQVVSGHAELTARGWEACFHEAKRVKDMMTAAGGRVPSWLVKV